MVVLEFPRYAQNRSCCWFYETRIGSDMIQRSTIGSNRFLSAPALAPTDKYYKILTRQPTLAHSV